MFTEASGETSGFYFFTHGFNSVTSFSSCSLSQRSIYFRFYQFVQSFIDFGFLITLVLFY